MTIPTIFETCRPRADVLRGAITEADFAADLAQVIVGKGNEEYLDPGLFFAKHLSRKGPQEPARQCVPEADRSGR